MEISSKVRISDLLQCERLSADSEIAFHISSEPYQTRRISYSDLSAQIRDTVFDELSAMLTGWSKTYIDDMLDGIKTDIRQLSVDLSSLSVNFHSHLSNSFKALNDSVDQDRYDLHQLSGYVRLSCVPAIIKIANCQLDVKGTLSAISTDLSVNII